MQASRSYPRPRRTLHAKGIMPAILPVESHALQHSACPQLTGELYPNQLINRVLGLQKVFSHENVRKDVKSLEQSGTGMSVTHLNYRVLACSRAQPCFTKLFL